MPPLLFEIGCEELPARAVREAGAQLPALAREHLGTEPAELFLGPRRLALLVPDVPARTPDEWIKGPPVTLREQAAEGFARRHGVAVDDLQERDGFLGVEVPGRPLVEVLPERLDALVRGLTFSKSMRWDDDGLRFSRPVRWLCAKLGDEDVLGGGVTYGHRFTSGAVHVPTADAYGETLRDAGVEPEAAERERRIRAGLDAIGDWSDPAGVLAEVVHLVESPLVLEGHFHEEYLGLPPRVIQTAMQAHQRYFPLIGNRFAFVANGGDPATVTVGNENVLNARLEDASFTFERDVAVGIDGLDERLESITFFAGAGSYAEKRNRLLALVGELGGDDDALEAARLAKADQAAELVREFPELEGHIGAEYARLAGRPDEVCAAIDEQYLPDAADAPLPSTEAGRLLSAADKLDTLRVSFALGNRPSGSRDPYGLRRAAIGVCRLATEGGVRVPRPLFGDDVVDFVEERLEGLLDVPVEVVRAARGSSVQTLGDVAALARALADLSDERLDRLHTVFTRAHRIVVKAEDDLPAVDPALFTEDVEREVAAATAQARAALEQAQAHDEAVAGAEALAAPLERFFEDVLVMADDASVRRNRLALLRDVRDVVRARLGDLSQIPR